MDCDWRSVMATLPGRRRAARRSGTRSTCGTTWSGRSAMTDFAGFTHAFLIREPERMIASYLRKREAAAFEDFGLERQAEFFDREADRLGRAPPVIDANDVLADPRRRAASSALRSASRGIRRCSAGRPGRRETDGPWAPHWYGAVEKKHRFWIHRKLEPVDLPDWKPGRLAERCRPYVRAARGAPHSARRPDKWTPSAISRSSCRSSLAWRLPRCFKAIARSSLRAVASGFPLHGPDLERAHPPLCSAGMVGELRSWHATHWDFLSFAVHPAPDGAVVHGRGSRSSRMLIAARRSTSVDHSDEHRRAFFGFLIAMLAGSVDQGPDSRPTLPSATNLAFHLLLARDLRSRASLCEVGTVAARPCSVCAFGGFLSPTSLCFSPICDITA